MTRVPWSPEARGACGSLEKLLLPQCSPSGFFLLECLYSNTHLLPVCRGRAGRQDRSLPRGLVKQSLRGYSTWQRCA